MLSEIFWTFVVTSIVGLVIVISKLCFKSKCRNIDFCCLRIERDVQEEKGDDVKL